jgi:hypothetical protein
MEEGNDEGDNIGPLWSKRYPEAAGGMMSAISVSGNRLPLVRPGPVVKMRRSESPELAGDDAATWSIVKWTRCRHAAITRTQSVSRRKACVRLDSITSGVLDRKG